MPVAEQAFLLNDRYSAFQPRSGLIQHAIDSLENGKLSSLQTRLLSRYFSRGHAEKSPYFVHPGREWLEYLLFLHAILDDTDLLTKVSQRDVICVASLLNRLKTLELGEETEIVHLDDIEKGAGFAKEAAARLLHTPDLYSIYNILYKKRREELEEQLKGLSRGELENLFADTKELNGAARVGQIKLFSANFPTFLHYLGTLKKTWIEIAKQRYEAFPHLDLHLLMITTILSAEDVYGEKTKPFAHEDQLVIWIPDTNSAFGHLASFLSAFKQAPELKNNPMHLTAYGELGEKMSDIFRHYFLPLKITQEKGEGHAVLSYKAGSLNSRKSMISPYLS